MDELSENVNIFNGDCFDLFDFCEDGSVDLMVLDLPYANLKFGSCTSCEWDLPIDLDKMWVQVKRILKKDGIAVFFCDTKFGYCLINTNPKWFKYQLIWKKSRKVGFLSCNKQPLRQSENIYVFKDQQGTYNPQKTKLDKPSKVVRKNNHVSSVYGDNVLGEESLYIDRHPTNIIDHENMYIFKDKQGTYNPQMTEGTPYKQKSGQGEGVYNSHKRGYITENQGTRYPTDIVGENIYVFKDKQGTYNPQKTTGHAKYKNKGGSSAVGYYRKKGEKYDLLPTENDGTRYPSNIIGDTILEFNNPVKSLHSTQKPVKLLEWLIKTYSNEGETIMDFTMGSGSCGVACVNTNRKFIGCEKDTEIYETAYNRLVNHIEEREKLEDITTEVSLVL